MTTLPMRSLDQRHAALAVANMCRARRRAFKQELRTAEHPEPLVAELLQQCPPWAENWRVYDLLCAMRYYGPRRVSKVLRKAGVSEVKRVGGLTAMRRTELIWELTGERSA